MHYCKVLIEESGCLEIIKLELIKYTEFSERDYIWKESASLYVYEHAAYVRPFLLYLLLSCLKVINDR